MKFVGVTLQAPSDRLRELENFYIGRLGLEQLVSRLDAITFAVGETKLEFVVGRGEPFYHFALLVPGDRFDAALGWAKARVDLLPDPETGEVVFDFENWAACACYFFDSVGNIVELIAHRGISEAKQQGNFRAAELVALSELGLVGNPGAMAKALTNELALELWDGTADEPNRLAFVGQKGRTLILSPPGRGWLPTGRPAEPHPAEVGLSSGHMGEAWLEGLRYHVRGA
jgi:hypothetical protein